MIELRRLCVFCGSNPGSHPAYVEAARALGGYLARSGTGLVYGGGNVGLMGVIADAALQGGGEVIGVIPKHLEAKELAHRGLTQLHVVDTMHQRKAMMADLADAFVALPGGLGTFEELFEMATWTQLGIHDKPVGLLDVQGYYAPLVTMLRRAVADGFLRHEHAQLVAVSPDHVELLAILKGFEPSRVIKWLDKTER